MVEIVVVGQTLETDESTKIKYTSQISDIFDIAKVKASHTDSFSIPKTPNNVHIFQGLGLVGSTSSIPYDKIPATIKENGFDVVRNGWLNIKETTDRYQINIIDGAIDFYKDIENINIGDLDLSEINHTKTLESVIESFSNEFYRYIIGDYNGKNLVGEETPAINIDYQVPSARYKYLVEKIFQSFGWSYEGSIFSNEDYLDSWVTFPKETFSEEDQPKIVAELRKYSAIDNNPVNVVANTWAFPALKDWDSSTIYEGDLLDNWSFVAPETNQYQIRVSAKGWFRTKKKYSWAPNTWVSSNKQFFMNTIVNGQTLQQPLNVYTIEDEYFTTYVGNLQEGDIVTFEITGTTSPFNSETPESLNLTFFNVDISRNENPNISFTDEFKHFKITDFFNDFLRRFALTMVVDTDERKLNFYTLQERLDKTKAIDWSDKFVRRTKEIYVTGSYAQNNYFRQKYNGENQEFSDGVLIINNKNLPNDKTIYTSPFYSRTETFSDFLEANLVYPIWEREPKEVEGVVQVSYKSLSGRWYVIKSKENQNTVTFVSELSGASETVSGFPELYGKNTHYSELTPIYYDGYQSLLNSCKIHEMEFVLTELDRMNFDFIKPIYVEAESCFYLVNKITFEKDKPSKVEAIKINYSNVGGGNTHTHTLSFNDGCFSITNFIYGEMYHQFSYNGGDSWQTGSVPIPSSPSCGYTTSQPVLFRLVDRQGNIISNTIQINP